MRTLLLALVTATKVLAQDPCANVYIEKAWAHRDAWQKAESIIRQLHLQPGSRVADVGCHEGYMTVKLAAKVASTGTVYAVDLEQPRLNKLKQNLEARKVSNVTILKGDADNPQLPEGTLDAVLILDTYHEMKAHDKILEHIRNSLKPGGRLVICEPISDERRTLSREAQEKKHELGMAYVVEDLKKAGFQIVFKQDPFIDRRKIKDDQLWIVTARK